MKHLLLQGELQVLILKNVSQTPKKWRTITSASRYFWGGLTSFHHLHPATNIPYEIISWSPPDHHYCDLETCQPRSGGNEMQFYHRFGNVCTQQLKDPPQKKPECNFSVSQLTRIKLGKNLELWREIAFRIGGKKDTSHEAETAGEMPGKVGKLIPISPSLSSVFLRKSALLPVLWLECAPFLLWGFAEANVATIEWLGFFLHPREVAP